MLTLSFSKIKALYYERYYKHKHKHKYDNMRGTLMHNIIEDRLMHINPFLIKEYYVEKVIEDVLIRGYIDLIDLAHSTLYEIKPYNYEKNLLRFQVALYSLMVDVKRVVYIFYQEDGSFMMEDEQDDLTFYKEYIKILIREYRDFYSSHTSYNNDQAMIS